MQKITAKKLVPSKILNHLKDAYSEGQSDLLNHELVVQSANNYIDNNLDDIKLSDNERDLIINAYCDGFYGRTLKL